MLPDGGDRKITPKSQINKNSRKKENAAAAAFSVSEGQMKNNKRAVAALYIAAGAALLIYALVKSSYLLMCIGILWLSVGVVYLIRK